jgi:protein CWC15
MHACSYPLSQPGQTDSKEVAKRDLRAELLVAEHEAKNKKRKALGQPPLPFPGLNGGAVPKSIEGAPANSSTDSAEDEVMDEETRKRRKVLQEALELDRDDSDDEDEDEDEGKKDRDGDEGMKDGTKGKDASSDEDDDDDSDDDEDETAVLLRELEKIKRERAEEKAKQEASANADAQANRDADIATGNPLLNLAAALGADAPKGISTTERGTFSVKRRWDDGSHLPVQLMWASMLMSMSRCHLQEPGNEPKGPIG